MKNTILFGRAFRRSGRVLGVALAAAAGLALLGAPRAQAADEAAPAYSKKGADTCLNCHDEDNVTGLFKTRHAQPNNPDSPFGHGQLQCEACHGPGGAHATGRGKNRPAVIRFGKGSETPVAVQNQQCLGCHERDTKHQWAATRHAAAGVGCADCHRSHDPMDRVQRTATQSQVCYDCHKTQQANANKPFTHGLRQGEMTCTGCHDAHGSTTKAALKGATLNETCYSCHPDLRGPFVWEHAPVTENCGQCHDPHGSIHPAMLKQRGPFQCQSCHSVQGHPSVAYGPSGLPGGSAPSAAVVAGNCTNCHTQVHGSNHPSGRSLTR